MFPPNTPKAALLDGALLTPGKTPTVERDLPPQPTAPPWDHGAGVYHSDVKKFPPVDLSRWKQQDYAQLPYSQELTLHLPLVIETGVKLPTVSIGGGAHGSLGMGIYSDFGSYIVAGDTTGDLQILQPYVGGGGTSGIFAEITGVFFISNAPLEKWPGWSINVGGSVEVLGSIGIDAVLWKDEQGHHYFGLQITPGIGFGFSPEFGLPVEFHGGVSYIIPPLWRLKR